MRFTPVPVSFLVTFEAGSAAFEPDSGGAVASGSAWATGSLVAAGSAVEPGFACVFEAGSAAFP